jgi:hypothetical protein
MFRSIRLISAAALAALTLAGCATAPKQAAFNRDAAHVKTIAVLPMRKSELDLMILNNPGYSFGLIGTAIAEANRIPKRNTLREHAQQAGLDHVALLKEELSKALAQRGYDVRWTEPVMEDGKAKTSRDGWGVRKKYDAIADADAQLDVNFGFVGYAAAGSSDGAPYRPTAVVTARLVSADGKRELFSDFVVYNNVFGRKNAITINPNGAYVYPDFDDLDHAGPKAIDGLRDAVGAAANELAKQL